MSNAYNTLVNTFKSPSSTEEEIIESFHSYYKTTISFCFNKTHMQIIKKLQREFIYKFLFDQGYIFSLKDNIVADNAFLIYNTYDFYVNPNKTFVGLTQHLNENKNKQQLQDIQYIYEHYKPILDIISSTKENIEILPYQQMREKERKIAIDSIADIHSKHPIYQKFILLNLFNYDFKLSYFLPLFETFKDTAIFNFFINSFYENFPLGVHYVRSKGKFDNGYFNPKYFPEHDFLLFLSNNNLLYLFEDIFLVKYLKYDFIFEYLKNNLLNHKNFYNDNTHYTLNNIFEDIFMLDKKAKTNFDKFIILMFENIKLNQINYFFKHDAIISNYRKNVSRKEIFNVLKHKFELFCQSDFDSKIISQKSFFLNDMFLLKNKITVNELMELNQILESDEKTLLKFKSNIKYINSNLRPFFIINDF